MNVDGWSVLMALAVILLPLLIAGALLGRPARRPKHRRAVAPQSRHSKHSKPSNETP